MERVELAPNMALNYALLQVSFMAEGSLFRTVPMTRGPSLAAPVVLSVLQSR